MRSLKEEGGTKEEEDAAVERVRDVYERAVAQVPPGHEKRHWRRYIFLWFDYALFEEIETKVWIFLLSNTDAKFTNDTFIGLRASTTGLQDDVKSCAS